MEKGYVDTKTKKIFGCKPYSRVWWHEKGHIDFAITPLGAKLHLTQSNLLQFFFVSLLAAILWKPLVIISGIILLIYFTIDLYEESWCWRYADAMANS